MRRDSHDARQLMDTMYRHQRHIYDLSRRYYLLGRKSMIAGLQPPERGTVAELGCGTAWNLIQIARRYPQAQLFGADLSGEMLKTARRSVAAHELERRIALAEADSVTFDAERTFRRRAFDRVVLSYTLSMIPAWTQVVERAIASLAPGGSLHIIDFGQCEALPVPLKVGIFGWLEQFHVSPRPDLLRVIARIAERERMQLSFTPLYRGYAWHLIVRRG